jgi:glyoxylase-like metal-dependent hydrolase (beta-lactamase superfamily II)
MAECLFVTSNLTGVGESSTGTGHEAHDHAVGARPLKQEQEEASEEITEVAPGVLRLQLPMAFTGLGHVNTYALEGPEGWAIVDPGLPGKMTAVVLRSRLAAAGIPMARITDVVVTHSHPDHFGGAGLLAEKAGAAIVASERFTTWWDPGDDVVEDPAAATPDAYDDGQAFEDPAPQGRRPTPFGRPTPWGGKTFVPPLPVRLRFRMRAVVGSRWFSAPKVTRRVADGAVVHLAGRPWTGLITPGHTADHLCLLDADAGVLLSGDHVLPTITPHVGGLGARDPLADYVASLHRVAALGDVVRALPAHGHPFTGLAARAADIITHHDERIERLVELLAADSPVSVNALSLALFGRHGADPLAVSETYAHLEHLRRADRATRRREGDELLYAPVA